VGSRRLSLARHGGDLTVDKVFYLVNHESTPLADVRDCDHKEMCRDAVRREAQVMGGVRREEMENASLDELSGLPTVVHVPGKSWALPVFAGFGLPPVFIVAYVAWLSDGCHPPRNETRLTSSVLGPAATDLRTSRQSPARDRHP
jgi:hypothetical protein